MSETTDRAELIAAYSRANVNGCDCRWCKTRPRVVALLEADAAEIARLAAREAMFISHDCTNDGCAVAAAEDAKGEYAYSKEADAFVGKYYALKSRSAEIEALVRQIHPRCEAHVLDPCETKPPEFRCWGCRALSLLNSAEKQ